MCSAVSPRNLEVAVTWKFAHRMKKKRTARKKEAAAVKAAAGVFGKYALIAFSKVSVNLPFCFGNLTLYATNPARLLKSTAVIFHEFQALVATDS